MRPPKGSYHASRMAKREDTTVAAVVRLSMTGPSCYNADAPLLPFFLPFPSSTFISISAALASVCPPRVLFVR